MSSKVQLPVPYYIHIANIRRVFRSVTNQGYWPFFRDPHDADDASGVNPTVPAIRARDAVLREQSDIRQLSRDAR